MTLQTRSITTNSPEETKALAQSLAATIRSGEVVCLYGNLGAGKTTFVHGFASALGVKSRVQSPTYIYQRCYKGSSFELHHFDLYRLTDSDHSIEQMVYDSLEAKNTVTIIEWPEKIMGILPAKRVDVYFSEDTFTTRTIRVDDRR